MNDKKQYFKQIPETLSKLMLAGNHELLNTIETDKHSFKLSVTIGHSKDYIKRSVIGKFTDYTEYQEFDNQNQLTHFMDTETVGNLIGLREANWNYLDSNEEILGLVYAKSIQGYKEVQSYSKELDSIPKNEEKKLADECIKVSRQLKQTFTELNNLHNDRYERVGERYDQLGTMNPEKSLIDTLAELHHELDEFLDKDKNGDFSDPIEFREGVAELLHKIKSENPEMVEFSENKDMKIAGEKHYYM